MCESCCAQNHAFDVSRRDFIKAGTAASLTAAAAAAASMMSQTVLADELKDVSEEFKPLPKSPAKVTVAFMYPPREVVEAGEFEDSWAVNKWSTYPGPYYEPAQREQQFRAKVEEINAKLGMEIDFYPTFYTKAAAAQFVEQMKAQKPDAVFIFCFWNTMQNWVAEMCSKMQLPAVVYVPVGASHQLPNAALANSPDLLFIHSFENWSAIEGALRAVNAHKKLSQSRMIRVGEYPEEKITVPSCSNADRLNVEITAVPAQIYNQLFDSVADSPELLDMAKAFKAKAQKVLDVDDVYIQHGIRSWFTLQALKKRYNADAVTIKCLMLKERKPCIGFSLLNSVLSPCACEDQADSLLTIMLGNHLLDRAGFLHNPDFDTERNEYYGSHCTTPLQMYPAYQNKPEVPFFIRPFAHMLPKTAAIDARFPENAQALIAKFTFDGMLSAYTGRIISSPEFTSAGGCTTRFRMDMEKLEDVCAMYRGPHPILFLTDGAEQARWFKMYAKLYGYDWKGNC